jgi:hypothetical protein
VVYGIKALDGDQLGNVGILGQSLDDLAIFSEDPYECESGMSRATEVVCDTHATVTGSSETLQAS